ncbi:MAG: hypothetical protein A3K66_04865 [Euryarchaeota archaeon RBG_16_67_27]|nr:MAG: hypothetical protein A3K66_04865 [Euryarchaeota archaeon RBG_16_67_27]
MDSLDRGPLLYAYRPIPANPMSVAVLLVLAAVTFGLGPLAAAPSGMWPLDGACFLPIVVALAVVLAFKPSPTFVFENGIDVSLPLWRRVLGEPRHVPWSVVRDVYPASYEVAGSFMSPFASSAGTLVHVGIGIETNDGRRRLVRFTPGTIRTFRAESPAFLDAMAVIRDRYARNGQPMVTTAKRFTDAEVLDLQARAREPLASIAGVFLAFFLPPVIVGVALLAATGAGIEVTTPITVAALLLAALPPAVSMLRTLRRSERRNAILSELAKFQERLRGESSART